MMKQTQKRTDQQEACAKSRTFPSCDPFHAETLANMSHELGSPLAAIQGYTSTLLRLGPQIDPEERQAFLQAIQDAGDRMHDILDHLLTVSQLEAGIRPVQCTDVNLVLLVQEALGVAERRVKRKPPTQGVSPPFRFVLQNRLPEDQAIVQADRALLREALDNLLENAVRYSPRGGRITILLHLFRPRRSIAALPASLPWRALSVSDQGIGIAREHLDLIFAQFYRVDTSLTRETGGLGLGLALCRRVAELHQGTIQVESIPGRGSTFHLLLPGVCPL